MTAAPSTSPRTAAATLSTSLDLPTWVEEVAALTEPDDVVWVEDRTYIASATPEGAGPDNHWREPVALRAEPAGCFAASMRGRTLYVVPFSMGPVGGPLSELGWRSPTPPASCSRWRS